MERTSVRNWRIGTAVAVSGLALGALHYEHATESRGPEVLRYANVVSDAVHSFDATVENYALNIGGIEPREKLESDKELIAQGELDDGTVLSGFSQEDIDKNKKDLQIAAFAHYGFITLEVAGLAYALTASPFNTNGLARRLQLAHLRRKHNRQLVERAREEVMRHPQYPQSDRYPPGY